MNLLLCLTGFLLSLFLKGTNGAALAHESALALGSTDTATINDAPSVTTSSQEEDAIDDATMMTTHYSDLHRRLPGFDFDFNRIGEAFENLLSTPPTAWEASQWILFVFLLFTALYCCGCIACNRRRQRYYGQGYPGQYGPGGYGQGGYGYGGGYGGGGGKSGGGAMSCLRNMVLCFCCYELFCADCADVPCFNHSRFGGGEEANNMYRGDIV